MAAPSPPPAPARSPSTPTSAPQREFPRLAEVNPPRWELGHIGWFQEFWCRRHAADDPAGARTPSRIAGADALWNSARVPHDTRWDLPLPDWDGMLAYLAACSTTRWRRSPRRNAHDDLYFAELALLHEDMHDEALLMTLQTLALPPPPSLGPQRHRSPARRSPWRRPRVSRRRRSTQGSSPGDAARRFVWDNERWSHR